MLFVTPEVDFRGPRALKFDGETLKRFLLVTGWTEHSRCDSHELNRKLSVGELVPVDADSIDYDPPRGTATITKRTKTGKLLVYSSFDYVQGISLSHRWYPVEWLSESEANEVVSDLGNIDSVIGLVALEHIGGWDETH
ncbi:hypothetical protein [Vibrio phage vB_VpaP_SJSY21]|nr:hypothetical protein [Vibrio phage vB_VpaP_SJSY21]